MKTEDIAAVARTIELIEKDAWPQEKRLAESLRAWLKGKL